MWRAFGVANISNIKSFLMHQIQWRQLTALHYHSNTVHVRCKCNIFYLNKSHGLTAPPDGLQSTWQCMQVRGCIRHRNYFFPPFPVQSWSFLLSEAEIMLVQKSRNPWLLTREKSNKKPKEDSNHKEITSTNQQCYEVKCVCQSPVSILTGWFRGMLEDFCHKGISVVISLSITHHIVVPTMSFECATKCEKSNKTSQARYVT